MGALRLEPARVQAWASRSASAVWGAFDVQLVLYALSLAVIGLLVAYANSPTGDALGSGTTLTRGLVWLALAIVAFIAYRLRELRHEAAHGRGPGDHGSTGSGPTGSGPGVSGSGDQAGVRSTPRSPMS